MFKTQELDWASELGEATTAPIIEADVSRWLKTTGYIDMITFIEVRSTGQGWPRVVLYGKHRGALVNVLRAYFEDAPEEFTLEELFAMVVEHEG